MLSLPRPSCVKCTLYLTCKDSQKNTRGYSCVKFKRLREISDIGELSSDNFVPKGEDEDLVKRKKKKSAIVVPETLEIEVADNFVLEAMEKAYDPNTNMVRDLKIDDSDLPLAANFYHYCAELAGKNVKMPFVRQLWMGLMLMGEMCPECSHPKSQDMWNIPVDLDPHDFADAVTLLEYGVCPSCNRTKFELIKSGKLKDYVELVLVGGQRMGKSTLTASLVAYCTHRLLKAPKLSTISRGIQDFTPLTASFVALTTTKAQKLLWNPVRDLIGASEWFTDYFKMLDHFGKKYGKEFYQFNPTGTYFRAFHKNLDMYPEGPSKRTLRGPTRFLSATDELGHFPYSNTAGEDEEEDERERANGDEVHQVLTNSLATVRTEVSSMYERGIYTIPQGFNLSISSPASFKDKIMRLYAETKDSDIALGVKAATWEISPLYQRDHPIIADMYRRNPRKADRDFGANPPSLESSIFNKELILPLFQEDRVLAIAYVDHAEKTRAKVVVIKEQARLNPAILALDAGLTNNAFALSLTHKDPVTGQITGRATLEVVPLPGKKIDFPYLYENVIKPVIRTQNVKWVFADRWNSIHILQQIETDFPTVKATQYSLKAKDFANFIEVVGDGKLSLGALELPVERIETVLDYKKELKDFPNSHLFLQFLTVQLQGGMIYKGGANTDDLFRALVLGVARHYDAKVNEYLEKFKPQDREGVSTNAVVLVAGRSGMTSNFYGR